MSTEQPAEKSTSQRARRQRYLKRSKQKGLDFHKEVIAKEFPAVFGDWKKPKPLAIGISKQLKEHYQGKVATMAIQGFITAWVSTFAYKKALIKGNLRYNLDGSKASLIDEAAIKLAKAELDSMIKKAKRFKQSQQKPKKQPAPKPKVQIKKKRTKPKA